MSSNVWVGMHSTSIQHRQRRVCRLPDSWHVREVRKVVPSGPGPGPSLGQGVEVVAQLPGRQRCRLSCHVEGRIDGQLPVVSSFRSRSLPKLVSMFSSTRATASRSRSSARLRGIKENAALG